MNRKEARQLLPKEITTYEHVIMHNVSDSNAEFMARFFLEQRGALGLIPTEQEWYRLCHAKPEYLPELQKQILDERTKLER